MKLLYEHDLIFGRLMEISQDYLIARYRKAMEGFGLAPTKLDNFHIDMTGFSPQIAKEMGDDHYLDPLGVNRRFIILSPQQENLPVVHTKFSNTGWLMHQFFKDNARALRAITIKDALYGEIDDPVDRVEDIDDLLSIEQVTFDVRSSDSLIDKAHELRNLADRLAQSDDAWQDDQMINRMVELAQMTGDIRHNKLVPEHLVFAQGSYWANHFGGVFVFRDERTTTVICDSKAPGFRKSRPWQVSYIEFDDHKRIFNYLEGTGRLQLPNSHWVKRSQLLEHRAEMVIRQLLQMQGDQLAFDSLSDASIKRWMRAHSALINKDGRYPFYRNMIAKILDRQSISAHEVDAKGWLMMSRAATDHQEQWLVNRLLARLNPSDYVSRFMFDKQGFYHTYQSYDDGFKKQVVSKLKDTYLTDKAALRDRLYETEGKHSYA